MVMSTRDYVLIVDDQENNRLLVEDHLRKFNYDVHGVSSGEEALSMLSTIHPDCILMDIMMTGIDGIETTRRIKEMKEYQDIPILMLSARDEDSTIQDAIDAGAVDYIEKPFKAVALVARVRSSLRTRHFVEELHEFNSDLQAKKKELSEFTHMVSHDLKSPVVGAASLFNFFLHRLDEDFPEIRKDEGLNEMLDRIPDSFSKMLSFVNTLLDYAESGRVIGEQEWVSMEKVVDSVIGNFEYADKEGMVSFERMEKLPRAWCDPVRMLQVWQNLISNAIKYRGDINPVRIRLGGSRFETGWRFWVEDNGPGIPEEYQEKIFEPFVRADDETQGSGIGLATSKRIMKAHGGEIHVDSTTDKGARFVFELPLSEISKKHDKEDW